MKKQTLMGLMLLTSLGCGGRYHPNETGIDVPTSGRNVVAVDADNRLVTFNANAPGALLTDVKISGVRAGDRIVALDQRLPTGALYGMSQNGDLYTIDPTTGDATPRGTGLGQPLNSSITDIDFDPSSGELRVVAGTSTNLRVDPETGTLVASDPDFTYKDAGTAVVSGIGFGNVATLYAYASYNQLSKIASPNSGVVTFYRTDANLPIQDGAHGLDVSPDGTVAILAADGAAQGIVASSSAIVLVDPATGGGASVGNVPAGLNLVSLAFLTNLQ